MIRPKTAQAISYDSEGHRVEQDTSGGSGAHTYYLPGNVEEVTPSGSLVKYYAAGGLALGENTATDASGISYLASDGLGSVSEALDGSGNVAGSQLYSPYGGVRYTNGTMPTSKGFTGQYADAATGLDYYGARYYDASLGQFTSADTAGDGLNRYGYVKGNPETYSDPTGHKRDCRAEDSCGPGDPNLENGGGNGTTTGDGPDYCNQRLCHVSSTPKTCDALCKYLYDKGQSDYQQKLNKLQAAQRAAQQNASDEASTFHNIGFVLGLIAAGLGVIAAILAAAGNFVVSIALASLAFTLAQLGMVANKIGDVFDDEKRWSQDMFTKDNVEGEKAQMEQILDTSAGVDLSGGAAVTLVSFIPKVAKVIGGGGTAFGIAGFAVALYSTKAMVNIAEGDLDNQAASLHM